MSEALPDALRRALDQALATGPLEGAAVACGVAYILLAIRQKRTCWLFGGLSTALYLFVFLETRLYLQAALQVLYVAMAAWGWRAWGLDAGESPGLGVRRLGWRAHAAVLAAVLALSLASALALSAWSDAAAPWADALGTWASVAATALMVRKVAANWLWWIVVDTGLAALFFSQGLVFTAVLYLAFAALAVAGWAAWRSGHEIT